MKLWAYWVKTVPEKQPCLRQLWAVELQGEVRMKADLLLKCIRMAFITEEAATADMTPDEYSEFLSIF